MLCYSEGKLLWNEPQFTDRFLVVDENTLQKSELDSEADELKLSIATLAFSTSFSVRVLHFAAFILICEYVGNENLRLQLRFFF